MHEFHSYEQIECTASDDEDLGIGTSGVNNGIYIDLPTSVSKFKWFNLITVDQTAYDPENSESSKQGCHFWYWSYYKTASASKDDASDNVEHSCQLRRC